MWVALLPLLWLGSHGFALDFSRSTAVPEPYPPLHGGSFSGPAVAASPDPLVRYRWDRGVDERMLQVYHLLPLAITASPPASFENVTSLKHASSAAKVLGVGELMVDFGTESAAWLELDSPDLEGAVTLSISEYSMPEIVNSGPKHPNKTAIPIRYGNTYRLELNDLLYEGVRFGFVHVHTHTKDWTITGMRAVCQIKPTNYTGTFSSSNAMLTKIWYTGAYAVKLNLMSNYFGSILIDRGDRYSWTGDAHTSQAAAAVAFSNFDFIKENLNRTSCKTCSQGIATYFLYWILSLLDYHMYTGDAAVLAMYMDNVDDKLHTAVPLLEAGNLAFVGGDERFGDYFEDPNLPGNRDLFRMLFLRCCFQFADVAQGVDPVVAHKWRSYANKMVSDLRKDPLWFAQLQPGAAAGAISAGFLTSEEAHAIYNLAFADEVNMTAATPFQSYFILEAMGKMNKSADALRVLDLVWGGQLRLGGTCFWEMFSPQWETFMRPHDPVPNGQSGYTSLCHPWSSGVTRWLTENVLGLIPMAPGYRAWRFAPLLSQEDNMHASEGQVRTSYGTLSGVMDETRVHVRTPPGTTGEVGIPRRTARGELQNIRVGTEVVWSAGFRSTGVTDDADRVWMRGVTGDLTALLRYSTPSVKSGDKGTLAPSSVPATYPIKFVGEDATTQGAWVGHYGTRGYVLFAHGSLAADVSNLPTSLISNVSYRHVAGAGTPEKQVWAASTRDVRALSGPEGHSASASALRTCNPQACRQSFYVHVTADEQPYNVSLYFVDWEDMGRRMVVEVFDGGTLAVAGQWRPVEGSSLSGGVYFTWRCHGGHVRFRVAHRRGMDAVLSGIFFD